MNCNFAVRKVERNVKQQYNEYDYQSTVAQMAEQATRDPHTMVQGSDLGCLNLPLSICDTK